MGASAAAATTPDADFKVSKARRAVLLVPVSASGGRDLRPDVHALWLQLLEHLVALPPIEGLTAGKKKRCQMRQMIQMTTLRLFARLAPLPRIGGLTEEGGGRREEGEKKKMMHNETYDTN